MLNYFNFQKFREKYLITNDLGRFQFVTKEELKNLVIEKMDTESEVYQKLKDNFFVFDSSRYGFADQAGMALREYKQYLFTATSLHIFVVTKQCNQHCVYCQASAAEYQNANMTEDTARKAINIALSSPSMYLTFEFQGGEPLVNFPIIKYMVEYTKEHKKDKRIQFVVVSNLLLLTEEMADFFVENQVDISTSLDGDEEIHNRNRPCKGINVYQEVEKKIAFLREKGVRVSAIQTTTQYTLQKYKELVDAYVSHEMEQIFIRPLTQLGYAEKNWSKIGYTSEEFLEFYRSILDYIIEQNKKGIFLQEGHAVLFLNKILRYDAGNYMELRSPCGAGIGQIAYYYNGEIYTCDEGRMLSEMGDKSFRIGNVETSTWKSIIEHPITRAVAKASFLEGEASCESCVYNPYCGSCPIISYAKYQNLHPQMIGEYRCDIYKGMQDIIFEKLYEEDEETLQVFYNWLY